MHEGGLHQMIQLRFNSLAGTDPAMLGPAPFFRIEGVTLQQGPDHSVVGRYFDHHWEIGDRFVSSYECVEPVCLHFEGAGGAIVRHLWAVPTGALSERLLLRRPCCCSRSSWTSLARRRAPHASLRGHWLHRGSLARWPVLVVSPAAPDVTLR